MATQTTRQPTVLDTLPKAELHLHLEGSIRPGTAVELAERHGVKLTAEDVTARYNYSNFAGFIEAFKWVTSFLRDPEDYALITRKLAEELVRQNVVYAEITISAGVMLRRMQNVEANFTAVREASESVLFSRLRTGWIVDAARQFGPEAAMEVARCAAKLHRSGVVAFGMGGDELAFPTVNFRPAFDLARSEGLRIVCHAGEIGGPESVREAVEILGAERVGHGMAVMHDPALADSLATRRVVLEICPSSNLCTGALAKQTGNPNASLADHPLAKLIAQGLLITLSTDDPAMFHTDLLTEYSHAASLGLSNSQLLQLAEQSFSAAFLPPIEKRQLLEDFRAAAKAAGLL
ncbi:MAG TPA: adenosine deaminase [Candidatus Acidoferrales bacterium]|nr:adenosine deaminase [Candidatus Acidoferrales bacterium]